MTACRCFRYISERTEDPEIHRLCMMGEKHAKAMADKIERMKEPYWECL